MGIETVINPEYAEEQSNNVTVVNASLPANVIPAGTVLLNKFTVQELFQASTGEADLYLCSSESVQYISKVYRRNLSIKNDVLDALKGINSPYVAKLIDVGVFEDKVVEVLPFYRNGSLEGKQFSEEDLKKTIIPDLNEGLKELHQKRIIHKDLKPSNIMVSDNSKDVVLIDFGISSALEEGQTVINTITGFSPEYAAPEATRNVFLEESDYYSLGITIYELYTGHTPFHNLSGDEWEQYIAVQKIPFPEDMPKDLKDLISGLTYNDLTNRRDKNNPNRRWTYNEVSKWCEGNPAPVPGISAYIQFKMPPYRFEGEEYKNPEDLVKALASNWEAGKKQLYRGFLTNYYSNFDAERAGYCVDAEQNAQNKHLTEDVAFWKLIYKLNPSIQTFYWRGNSYQSLQELGDEIIVGLRNREEKTISLCRELLQYGLISSYLNQRGADPLVNRALKTIEKNYEIEDEPKMEALFQLAFLLSSNHNLEYQGYVFENTESLTASLNKMLDNSVSSFREFSKNLVSRTGELDPQFSAWLVFHGKADALKKWKNKLI